MSNKFVISDEVAKQQLDLLCDWYGLDLEELEDALSSGDEDESRAVQYITKKLIKAIRQGAVEVQERELKDGGPTLVVVQTLRFPAAGETEIVYNEVTGASRANIKVTKGMNHRAEQYQFLAALAKIPASVFLKLRGSDIGVVDSLGFLFLQV